MEKSIVFPRSKLAPTYAHPLTFDTEILVQKVLHVGDYGRNLPASLASLLTKQSWTTDNPISYSTTHDHHNMHVEC